MRDSQRQRVYDSEAEFEKTVGSGQQFRNKDEVQAYLFNLMGSNWYQTQWPKAPRTITVRLNAIWARSSGGRTKIRISKGSMDEITVLHELAHSITGKEGGWHGRTFCINFLKLIRKKLSVTAEESMKACFKKHKVKFRPKRRVSTTAYTKGQTPPGFAALQKWREQQKAEKAA
jgi:putative metallohydrolase (TIGR04338 family)